MLNAYDFDLPCPVCGDECKTRAFIDEECGVLWSDCGKVFVWNDELFPIKEVFDFSSK